MSRPNKSRLAPGGNWQRKPVSRMTDGEIELGYIDNVQDDTPDSRRIVSTFLQIPEIGQLTNSDSFQEKVVKKTQKLLIRRQEAELEVLTDILVDKKGGIDNAFLHVVTSAIEKESTMLTLVNNLINRGADPSTVDNMKKTPLHYAAEKKFKGVAAKLLENNATAHTPDKEGTIPLKIAMDKKDDEMCALILAYMPNHAVRSLFTCKKDEPGPAELSFSDLLNSELQKSVLSVLDCMIESDGYVGDGMRVYYNILETDDQGRPPDHPTFDAKKKSPMQIIAKQGNKNIVYHDAMRLLIRRKWKLYARTRFQLNTFLYVFALFCLTYSAIVGVNAADPTKYDTPLEISRAVFEVISLIMACHTLFTEINQLIRHKLEYFHDTFNYLDSSSSILLILVLPLRYSHENAQWHVFAFGYLFWVIRIFKYAAVFRQTGAYAHLLFRILMHDFVQFGAVFFVILLAFSGSFFLSLRGDHNLDTHNETSTFWGIVFVGVRTLTEAQPVVEYTGEDGYKVVSTIFMVCFLFTCYVILLNILIAQLSDTYQKVQQDAQRGLEVNRAWIVARVELNSLWGRYYRRKHYIEYEYYNDLRGVLTRWESPPLNEMNKYIRDIWDSLDNHKMNLLTVQHRLARQENSLRQIRNQLEYLIRLQSGPPNGSDTGPSHPEPRHSRNVQSGPQNGSNSEQIHLRPARQSRNVSRPVSFPPARPPEITVEGVIESGDEHGSPVRVSDVLVEGVNESDDEHEPPVGMPDVLVQGVSESEDEHKTETTIL